jgi:hypothetical protein
LTLSAQSRVDQTAAVAWWQADPWLEGAVSESGKVGVCTREEVEMFCLSHTIYCFMDLDYENLFIDWRTTSDAAGATPSALACAVGSTSSNGGIGGVLHPKSRRIK